MPPPLLSSAVICPSSSPRQLVSSPFSKIFLFTSDPNHLLISHRPVPHEGRLAIVTDAGRDAVDVNALLTNSAEADGEVVWS